MNQTGSRAVSGGKVQISNKVWEGLDLDQCQVICQGSGNAGDFYEWGENFPNTYPYGTGVIPGTSQPCQPPGVSDSLQTVIKVYPLQLEINGEIVIVDLEEFLNALDSKILKRALGRIRLKKALINL